MRALGAHCVLVAISAAVIAATSCGDPTREGNSASEGHHDASASTEADVEDVSTFEEYCAIDAESYCSMLERCCVAAGVPYQRQVCDREVFNSASAPRAWCGLSQPPENFDAAAAARCLSLRRQVIVGCRFLRSDDPLVIEAAEVCDEVAHFVLTPPGTRCDVSPCFAPPGMTSACNVVLDSSEPPLCTAPVPHASLGQSCAGVAPRCAAGLQCADGRCARPLPDGSPCRQDDECSSNDCTDLEPDVELEKRVCEPFRAIGWDECALFTEPSVSR